MSGGIAYVWDIDGSFATKCNPEMVELCKLEDKDDLEIVMSLLKEFSELTQSVIAEQLIKEFDVRVKEFVKVFPYEYQRALKQRALVAVTAAGEHVNNKLHNGNAEPQVQDIEDSVADVTMEQKKVERALDKTKGK